MSPPDSEAIVVIKRAAGFSIALIGAALLPGCDQERAPSRHTVADSAGVQLASVELGVAELGWSVDTLVIIGGQEAGPGSFYRVSPAYVDVVGDEIFVLDRVAKRVEVFASDGSFRRAFSREGQGPGELEFPVTLSVDRAGVEVLDQAKGAIQRFTLSGEYLGADPYPFATIHVEFRHFDVFEGDRTLWRRDRRVTDGERKDGLVLQSDDGDHFLVTPTASPTRTAEYPECGMTYTIRLPLSGSPSWFQSDGVVAVRSGGGYRVEVFQGAQLAGRITAPEYDREFTAADAVRALRSREYVGPCNTTPAEVVARHGYDPNPPAIAGVAIGPRGRIWVKRAESAGGFVDVFTRGFEPLGSLPSSFPFPIAFLDDGRALIEVRDAMDVERVGVARIREN